MLRYEVIRQVAQTGCKRKPSLYKRHEPQRGMSSRWRWGSGRETCCLPQANDRGVKRSRLPGDLDAHILANVNDSTLKLMFIFKVSNKNTCFLQKCIHFWGSVRKPVTPTGKTGRSPQSPASRFSPRPQPGSPSPAAEWKQTLRFTPPQLLLFFQPDRLEICSNLRNVWSCRKLKR